MPVCLAGGGAVAVLAAELFALGWTHSIEKGRWEEDWAVVSGRLVAVEARVRGSGAGMEPGEGARLAGGWWRWRPDLPPQGSLVLRRSGAAGDWEVCAAGACARLGDRLPEGADPVVVSACAG